MRKLLGVLMVAAAAFVAGPGQAADFPEYPPIDVPEVDYGLSGSFYLRGSVGVNAMRAGDITYSTCNCGGAVTVVSPVATAGYGYSFGAGFGYETGDGLRTDFTVDYLQNTGLSDGTYSLSLRSTIAMANAYYDFNFGNMGGSAGGGFGAYIGAGIGASYNQTHVTGGAGAGPDGANWAPAGALMAGLTYDMGNIVTDIGYRMLYTPQITNGSAAMLPAATPYYINNAVTHELRGTVRYRFN
jgi:hypothetical protein